MFSHVLNRSMANSFYLYACTSTVWNMSGRVASHIQTRAKGENVVNLIVNIDLLTK